MTVIGYRRVSSDDQSLERQELTECGKVFEEKESGAKRDRPALMAMIDYAREGDRILVHSIDRLARDLRDLQDIVRQLTEKGVIVEFLSERLNFAKDSDAPFANLQLQLLGAFAEFERSIIRKRQAEGIAKAKSKGVYRGRKQSINAQTIRELHNAGHGATEIANELGIGRASVYRLLDTPPRS